MSYHWHKKATPAHTYDMGRLPKPKTLDDLAGNPTNRRGKKSIEPPAPEGDPTMPSYLDELAQTCWRETVVTLKAMNLLSRTDQKSLERYCTNYSRWRAAIAAIPTQGKQAQCEANNCAAQMEKFEQSFGMSPVARAKLRYDDGKHKADNPYLKKYGA